LDWQADAEYLEAILHAVTVTADYYRFITLRRLSSVRQFSTEQIQSCRSDNIRGED
jgi:hypothetical protein